MCQHMHYYFCLSVNLHLHAFPPDRIEHYALIFECLEINIYFNEVNL